LEGLDRNSLTRSPTHKLRTPGPLIGPIEHRPPNPSARCSHASHLCSTNIAHAGAYCHAGRSFFKQHVGKYSKKWSDVDRFKSWHMSWGSSLSFLTMKISITLLFSASSLFIPAMGRTFTVTNHCPFTIWYLSAFMRQLRHSYPHFFRPAVGILSGTTRFPRIHYGPDFHGLECWHSNSQSTNWVCFKSLLSSASPLTESVTVGLLLPLPPFRSPCQMAGKPAVSGYLFLN
jgi:hypothetical protein